MSAVLKTTAVFGNEILPETIAHHVPHFMLKICVVTFVSFSEPTAHTARVELNTRGGYYQRFINQVDLPQIAVSNVMVSMFDHINSILADPPDTETGNVSEYDLQAMQWIVEHFDKVAKLVTNHIAWLMA